MMNWAIFSGDVIYGIGSTKGKAFRDGRDFFDFDSTNVEWHEIRDAPSSGWSKCNDVSDKNNYFYARIDTGLMDLILSSSGDLKKENISFSSHMIGNTVIFSLA